MLKIYNFLKAAGIAVFFMGQHTGDCISPYVVIVDGNTSGQNSSNKVGSQLVDIIFYVPAGQYTKILTLKDNVKAMLATQTYLRYTANETGTITDDSVKGLTCSTMYEILKKF